MILKEDSTPRFLALTAIRINPFVQYKGLGFFGLYEIANNAEEQGDGWEGTKYVGGQFGDFVMEAVISF